MATKVFTDTPKIGVNIAASIPAEDIARSGHREGSTVVGSDGKTYRFSIDTSTGVGTWTEAAAESTP